MSMITFIIIQAPPGDYGDFIRTNMIVQGNATQRGRDAAPPRHTAKANGLNDPMVVQYVRWIWGIVLRGDFGMSYAYNKPVSEVIAQRLPTTIAIALTCHILASVLGISFGIIAATRQYTWVDTVLSFVSFLGMTVPRFLLALIILYILAYKINVQEIGSVLFVAIRRAALLAGLVPVQLGQAVEPDPAYLAGGRGRHLRRAGLQHAGDAGEPSGHAERAICRNRPRQGPVAKAAVIMRHAVPNALHPLVAYQGVVLPYMLTGEIEVAIVFGLATIGPAIVGSMAIGDVFVTASLLLVLGATLIVGNIIADLLLVALDPRIRVGRTDT